jgi:SAM-dependent methyltransferase
VVKNLVAGGAVLFAALLFAVPAISTEDNERKGPVGIEPNTTGTEKEVPAETKNGRPMNVSPYDEMARGLNGPMYDYYAKKIKETTGISTGLCVDVGSGGGYLGLALARITDLDFIFLDISADALEKTKAHIIEDGIQKRAKTLLADVHHIPLADGSVNLVISRGSIPFWKDPARGLREIYRILAPGGKAYVGGGRGTPEIQASIKERAQQSAFASPEESRPVKSSREGGGPKGIPQRDDDAILTESAILICKVVRGGDGMWIQIWKEDQPKKGGKS